LTAAFSFPNGAPAAKEETELAIAFRDESGGAVTEFEITHEKLLHLIVVSHDLSFFNHIHPDAREDGTFHINTSFPTGGEYKLFADVKPKGGAGVTLSEWVKVEGAEGKHEAIAPDAAFVKEASGKEIELAADRWKANEDVTLTFAVRDARTKEGIADLEPYLGAVGHVVILSADAERYLHVHPIDERSTGPEAAFATSFPEPGIYKIWGQFQHQGEVITVSYVVEVE